MTWDWLTWVFWLALALPGFALLCRFDRKQLDSGLLGVLGVSYLLSFAMLVPLLLVCFLLEFRVIVFGGGCCLLIVQAAVEITRRGAWRDAGRLLMGALGAGLLVLVLDWVAGARVGGYLGGDSLVHLTRVRQFFEQGFTNEDPFIGGGFFFPIYHTNVLHALCAACSWATDVDYLGVWWAGLPWAKLLVASGTYYLAWSIFERRSAAWCSAVFMAVATAPLTTLIYPNKLAPFWVFPILLGLVIQFCRGESGWPRVLQIAAGCVVIGLIHPLYAVFALLLIGPVMLASALVRFVRRRSDRWRQLACVACLSLLLPSPLVLSLTTRTGNAGNRATRGAAHYTSYVDQFHASFIELESGWIMVDPRVGFGSGFGVHYLLLVLAIVGAVAMRRTGAVVAAGVCAVAAALMFAPPLCSLLADVLHEVWPILRLDFVPFSVYAALLPGTLAFYVLSKLRGRVVEQCLIVALAAAGPFAMPIGELPAARVPAEAEWTATWPSFYAGVTSPIAKSRAMLDGLRSLRADLSEGIPPGTTVLASQKTGMLVAMLHSVHIIAPTRGSIGVPHLSRRQADLRRMLAWKTPLDERRELYRRYDVTHMVSAAPGDAGVMLMQQVGEFDVHQLPTRWIIGDDAADVGGGYVWRTLRLFEFSLTPSVAPSYLDGTILGSPRRSDAENSRAGLRLKRPRPDEPPEGKRGRKGKRGEPKRRGANTPNKEPSEPPADTPDE